MKIPEFESYKIIKKEGIMDCLLNNEKRYSNKDSIEEYVNDTFHIVRFQFWRHDNEEIALEIKNFRILWSL